MRTFLVETKSEQFHKVTAKAAIVNQNGDLTFCWISSDPFAAYASGAWVMFKEIHEDDTQENTDTDHKSKEAPRARRG